MTAAKTGNKDGIAEWRPSDRFAPYAEFGPTYRAENAVTYSRARQQTLALRTVIILVMYLPYVIPSGLVPNRVFAVYFQLWLVLTPFVYCLGIRKIVAPLIVAEGRLPFREAFGCLANDIPPILLRVVEIAVTAGCFFLWHVRHHHMSSERLIVYIALWIVLMAIASVCATMSIVRQDKTPVRR